MKTLDYRPLALGLALCSMLHAPCSFAREITGQSWNPASGPAKRMNLELFQGESVEYTQPLRSYTPDTNSVYVWEIRGWEDYTNVYAATTGAVASVTDGELYFELTGAEANIEEGTYLGFIKALHTNETRDVLASQRIKFEWSEWSMNYDLVEARPNPYFTKAEVLAIQAALSNDIAAVQAQISINVADISDLQDVDAASLPRLTQLESQTNLIQSAVQPTDSDYTTTAALAASALQSYTETDPVWNAASGSVYSAIGAKQDAATAATDTELQAATDALQADIDARASATDLQTASNALAAVDSAHAVRIVDLENKTFARATGTFAVNPYTVETGVPWTPALSAAVTVNDDALSAIDLAVTESGVGAAWSVDPATAGMSTTLAGRTDNSPVTVRYDAAMTSTAIGGYSLAVSPSYDQVYVVEPIYTGAAASTTLNSAGVLGLANKRVAREGDFSQAIAMQAGEYGYLAFPAAYSLVEIRDSNGFPQSWTTATVSVTRPGGAVPYTVMHTAQPMAAPTSMTFTFDF